METEELQSELEETVNYKCDECEFISEDKSKLQMYKNRNHEKKKDTVSYLFRKNELEKKIQEQGNEIKQNIQLLKSFKEELLNKDEEINRVLGKNKDTEEEKVEKIKALEEEINTKTAKIERITNCCRRATMKVRELEQKLKISNENDISPIRKKSK